MPIPAGRFKRRHRAVDDPNPTFIGTLGSHRRRFENHFDQDGCAKSQTLLRVVQTGYVQIVDMGIASLLGCHFSRYTCVPHADTEKFKMVSCRILSIASSFVLACLGVLASPAIAQVTYQFSAYQNEQLRDFEYTASDFILSSTTLIPGDLDSCNTPFPSSTSCSSVTFDPYDSTRDLVIFTMKVGNGTSGEFFYFPEGSLGTLGEYSITTVFGVPAHLSVTSPIPEPETYAMLLAGLGLLGFHARRRKQKEAALV